MKNNTSNLCPLCNSSSKVLYHLKKRLYHQCENCQGIFVDRTLILDNYEEKKRYEEHNNDVNDPGYQRFVSPITSSILRDYTESDKGLDFGSGTGPVISKVLKDNNYNIVQYDPFFCNVPDVLNYRYDYIACCEVIEHMHDPKKEFILLKKLLQPKGRLYCMTLLYDDSIDFHTWNYKDDHTHVFIFQEETIKWVQKEIGFNNVKIDNRLVIFS